MGDARDTRFHNAINSIYERWKADQERRIDAFAWVFDNPTGDVLRITRIEQLTDPTATMAAPVCEMCGTTPWILVTHPLSGKAVCLECKTKGFEGWVPCPATHKEGASCPLCRSHPGFVEELP